jgi:two-component system alkaline phosphatase synthesis response regulator PhoP
MSLKTEMPMENNNSALIIEDEKHMIELISIHLGDLGFSVDSAQNGRDGLKKALGKEYSLIVLDLMLPEMDGFEVCKKIRENNRNVPILMLTARSEEIDKVLGLELGADDYITKPFSIREFIARVKAIMRRVEVDQKDFTEGSDDDVLRFNGLRINIKNRTTSVDGKKIELTKKEFELLEMLSRNPGQVFSRSQLLETVWGYQYDGYNHTVNTHINRLRSKIEKDPSNPVYVQTVWGFGYRFMSRGGKQ